MVSATQTNHWPGKYKNIEYLDVLDVTYGSGENNGEENPSDSYQG